MAFRSLSYSHEPTRVSERHGKASLDRSITRPPLMTIDVNTSRPGPFGWRFPFWVSPNPRSLRQDKPYIEPGRKPYHTLIEGSSHAARLHRIAGNPSSSLGHAR